MGCAATPSGCPAARIAASFLGSSKAAGRRKSRSSCRACEATSDCAAIVNAENSVYLTHRVSWFYDDFVAGRSLAGSAAATRVLRKNRVGLPGLFAVGQR